MPSSAQKRAQIIATRRKRIVQRYCQLKSEIGAIQAARSLKRSRATLWRWEQAFAEHGLRGLVPRFQNSGRRSRAAAVHFGSRAISTMERLLLETGNKQRAWEAFTRSRHCPSALAKLKLKNAPAPLMRLVKLTPLQHGCKAFLSADGRRLLVKLKGFPTNS